MGNMTKSLGISLLFAAILISAFTVPTIAQSTTKPAMPEFTVELSGPAFDIPPTYTFNASTGLFDPQDGYHIPYSTLKIIIKNQPFTNQTNYEVLRYNVRIKPHNYPDNYWQELFHSGSDGYPIQASGDYTVIPLPIEGSQVRGTVIPTGASTDVQVEAMIGYIGRNQTYPYEYMFYGETSGWSSTQTVTVPPKTPFTISPSTTPTSTPTATSSVAPNGEVTLPLTVFIAIIAVLSTVICALSVLLLRRNSNRKTP
jgi:hypothetical protein